MSALKSSASLRRRATPLETARDAQASMNSPLPSPPGDENEVGSDDTVTKVTRRNSGDSKLGKGTARESPGLAVPSRLLSTPALPANASLYSPLSPTDHHQRNPLSESESEDEDTTTVMDQSHAQAHEATSPWADLPILITFVSPAVAFLTGGDYLKDVILTCFLVWYLHQLIQVPWDIYLASLPPPTPYFPSTRRKPNDFMQNQLRTTRLLSLILSAFTPFLGAWLLRIGASIVSPGSLSWFSTSLFVLAAGVRPWRHLTHVLMTRTDALHLAVHKPAGTLSRLSRGAPNKEKEKETERAREADHAKMFSLESELIQLRAELSALSARTRATSKSLKDTDRRAGTVEGRIELLERHGHATSPSVAPVPGGTMDALNMVGTGLMAFLQGLVCALFPFLSARFDEDPNKVPSTNGKGKKKTHRMRGSTNNLPPVPEADESPSSSYTSHHDAKVHTTQGAYPRLPSTRVNNAVDVATLPLRVMRGALTGFVKGVSNQ